MLEEYQKRREVDFEILIREGEEIKRLEEEAAERKRRGGRAAKKGEDASKDKDKDKDKEKEKPFAPAFVQPFDPSTLEGVKRAKQAAEKREQDIQEAELVAAEKRKFKARPLPGGVQDVGGGGGVDTKWSLQGHSSNEAILSHASSALDAAEAALGGLLGRADNKAGSGAGLKEVEGVFNKALSDDLQPYQKVSLSVSGEPLVYSPFLTAASPLVLNLSTSAASSPPSSTAPRASPAVASGSGTRASMSPPPCARRKTAIGACRCSLGLSGGGRRSMPSRLCLTGGCLTRRRLGNGGRTTGTDLWVGASLTRAEIGTKIHCVFVILP